MIVFIGLVLLAMGMLPLVGLIFLFKKVLSKSEQGILKILKLALILVLVLIFLAITVFALYVVISGIIFIFSFPY